ncbi:MFS transporter [Paenibacillus aurantiacus]|uniref:MFS transporter n=1 Tax=Paenibacillus aurantiacus TaxID=1936118 RepID=A0ABV5KT26_9BACL
MGNIFASRVFLAISFFAALANSIMFTTYAIYQVLALGLSPLELLLIGMVLELTVLLFEGITGVLADLHGRRKSIVTGMFVLGIGFLLEGSAIWLGQANPWMSAFVWLLIGQLFYGIGATFISGADAAWIADEVGESNAGPLFLRAGRYGLAGSLIGIPFSVLLSMAGANYPYLAGGALYVLLGAFLLARMPETGFDKPDRRIGHNAYWLGVRETWLTGVRIVRRQPVLMAMLGVTLLSGAASEGYDRLWQAHLMLEIGLPARWPEAAWVGILAMLSTLLAIPLLRYAENRLDIANSPATVRALMLLTVVRIGAVILFALAPGYAWAIAAILVHDALRTLSGPISAAWLNRFLESRTRATVLSMMGQSDALGQTAGGPIVGWIGSRYTIRASLLASAALMAPIAALYRSHGRRLRNAEPE